VHRFSRSAAPLLIIIAIAAVTGCHSTSAAGGQQPPPPARTEPAGPHGALSVVLTPGGAQRVGIQTAAAGSAGHGRTVVPSSALLDQPDVALDAAEELAALTIPAGIAKLAAAVRDLKATPEQRAAAAADHRDARAITPELVAALADPSGIVRVSAASAIGGVKLPAGAARPAAPNPGKIR
jgi:hypothetical protein